jgi:hypothetical protein
LRKQEGLRLYVWGVGWSWVCYSHTSLSFQMMLLPDPAPDWTAAQTPSSTKTSYKLATVLKIVNI